jgi:glucosyl-dolichyl phosphate glucuronosyltransferase
MMSKVSGCSVLIPSHGSASQLGQVLAALAEQTWKDFDVVLVDNNADPRLCGLQERLRPFPLRVVHEPLVGLSRARNVAVAHASGEYVAFLDDDTVPERSWLAELHAGLHRHSASVAGGSIGLGVQGEPPRWFNCDHRRLLAELLYDGHDIPSIQESQYICGGNMITSVRIFEAIGGFLESFGRVGSVLRSSEELEWCRRLQAAGLTVSFIASARVTHIIGFDRLRLSYFLKRGYWQGRSDALLECRHGRPMEFGPRSNRQNIEKLTKRLKSVVVGGEAGTRAGECIALFRELGYCIQYAQISRFRPRG